MTYSTSVSLKHILVIYQTINKCHIFWCDVVNPPRSKWWKTSKSLSNMLKACHPGPLAKRPGYRWGTPPNHHHEFLECDVRCRCKPPHAGKDGKSYPKETWEMMHGKWHLVDASWSAWHGYVVVKICQALSKWPPYNLHGPVKWTQVFRWHFKNTTTPRWNKPHKSW